MKRCIAAIALIWASQLTLAAEVIGPWRIKHYADDNVAHVIGARCAAVQYANGSDLMLTADPDDPGNKRTVQVFVSFADNYDAARVFVDDAMHFDQYLTTYSPDRGGSSGVFSISSISGRNLFATFSLGQMVVGRYQFSMNSLSRVSAYLHRKSCVFAGGDGPTVNRKAIGTIAIGDSRDSVVAKIGEPDNDTVYADSPNEDAEWTLGRNAVLQITFDAQKRVSHKQVARKGHN